MCVVCYLSTDRVIPGIPFDQNAPNFNIERLADRPASTLTKKFVYYCGSSQGCGCGFGSMEITETILQQTEKELACGPLSEETAWLWWNQNTPPPEDQQKFEEMAREIRDSHRDTEKLFRLIEETCQAGFPCELLVCWSGDEKRSPDRMTEVNLNDNEIDVDFLRVLENTVIPVLFYRFQ